MVWGASFDCVCYSKNRRCTQVYVQLSTSGSGCITVQGYPGVRTLLKSTSTGQDPHKLALLAEFDVFPVLREG